MTRRCYLVTYDIADDKRRTQVYKNLHNWGNRIQYSVFLCDLTAGERVRVESIMARLINHDEDQVLFVDLGPAADDDRGAIVAAIGKPFSPPETVLVV